ncbi:MAG: hypothetical protein ABI945_11585 [Nitrospirales bacterium]
MTKLTFIMLLSTMRPGAGYQHVTLRPDLLAISCFLVSIYER